MKKFESKNNNKVVAINIRVDNELNIKFQELVNKYDTTKSEYLRFLIERELEMEGLLDGKTTK